MAAIPTVIPASEFREELARRGGDTASKCYQCATCSAVCELAPAESPFPRREMLWAQWGLADRLMADPNVWLCHQCNDCTLRCPREAKPGDVLQAVRSMFIERLAFPSVLGRLVARARTTWPLLVGLPTLFWVLLLAFTGRLGVPAHLETNWAYEELVPHSFIYAVFFPVAAWVVLASWVSGRRMWKLMGSFQPRIGSFLGSLVTPLGEISIHNRFSSCTAAHSRKLAHLLLLWGFVGAAVTSGLLIVAIYIQHLPMPLPLSHPYKLLGNFSAGLLIAGGAMLVGNRIGGERTVGVSRSYDWFFLTLVVVVIATGMVVELARLADSPGLALVSYVIHLGTVMSLFLTFPYSKFAHMLYRTLAMIHQRAVGTK